MLSLITDFFSCAGSCPRALESPVRQSEGRKRSREATIHTPALVNDDSPRPRKKFRGVVPQDNEVVVAQEEEEEEDEEEEEVEESNILTILPDEVVAHVLDFCSSATDHFALQTTCKDFQRISNSDSMLKCVELGGINSGTSGIIQDDDTPAKATARLTPFANAGNLQAIYMLGMIKCYCNKDVDIGIHLLRHAADGGYVRANYTLGLILRDWLPEEAVENMQRAASKGYLPALQEILPAREMKAEYGEPSANELAEFLDPICLNRLLGRHYVQCPHLREKNTSHCWNPLCGRWAFKAQSLRQVVKDHSRVSRMKMCSRCCRAKYCSKLCQVHDWRSGRHKMECPFL